MAVRVVRAREALDLNSPSVFIAGPTPDPADPVPSWRPEVIAEFERQWSGPQVLSLVDPECDYDIYTSRWEEQVAWESLAREVATAVVFWVPRDMRTMAGFTTNIEFGMDVRSGKAVLGAPPGCANPERNQYLVFQARRLGAPVCESVPELVKASLSMVARRWGVGNWNTERLAGLAVHHVRRALAAGGEFEAPPAEELAALVSEFVRVKDMVARSWMQAAVQLAEVPHAPTGLTGPYWYGQGWDDAVQHLQDMADCMEPHVSLDGSGG